MSGWHSLVFIAVGNPDAHPILNRETKQTNLSFISRYRLSYRQHQHQHQHQHHPRRASPRLLHISHYLLKIVLMCPKGCAPVVENKTKQNTKKLPSYSPQYCRHLVRRNPSPPIPAPSQWAVSGDQTKLSSLAVLWPPVTDLCLFNIYLWGWKGIPSVE